MAQSKTGEARECRATTFVMDAELVEWLKDYAYTERLSIKEAVNELLGYARARVMADYAASGKVLIERPGKARRR